jgi:hypothetical protein
LENLLFTDAAQISGGTLDLESLKEKSIKIIAPFKLDHRDRQPITNIPAILISFITKNSVVDFIYKHWHNDRQFSSDLRQIRKEIEDVPINHPEIIKYIRGVIKEGLREIETEA